MKWISVELEEPTVSKIEIGYASEYYQVRTEQGEIHNARLEGSTPENTFWYSTEYGDQIDDVTHWFKK